MYYFLVTLFYIILIFPNNNFSVKEGKIYYKVQNGDSYSKIADKIFVPYREIINLNKKKKLYKNEIILLPNHFYYRIQKGDNFSKIIKKLKLLDKKRNQSWIFFFSHYSKKKLFYGRKIKIPISFLLLNKNLNIKKSEKQKTINVNRVANNKTKQNKQFGKIDITLTGERRLLKILKEIKEKNQSLTIQKNKTLKNSSHDSRTKSLLNFFSPIKNYNSSLIIQEYTDNYLNNGITLQNPKKDIYCIDDGEIVVAGFIRGLKKTMIIRHANNIFSIYGNLDFFFIKNKKLNKKVSKGQKIASGKVFYFAFFENEFINPLKMISF